MISMTLRKVNGRWVPIPSELEAVNNVRQEINAGAWNEEAWKRALTEKDVPANYRFYYPPGRDQDEVFDSLLQDLEGLVIKRVKLFVEVVQLGQKWLRVAHKKSTRAFRISRAYHQMIREYKEITNETQRTLCRFSNPICHLTYLGRDRLGRVQVFRIVL